MRAVRYVRDVAQINYEIPDDLHHQAKAAAAMLGVTLKAFVIEAISVAVGNEPED